MDFWQCLALLFRSGPGNILLAIIAIQVFANLGLFEPTKLGNIVGNRRSPSVTDQFLFGFYRPDRWWTLELVISIQTVR